MRTLGQLPRPLDNVFMPPMQWVKLRNNRRDFHLVHKASVSHQPYSPTISANDFIVCEILSIKILINSCIAATSFCNFSINSLTFSSIMFVSPQQDNKSCFMQLNIIRPTLSIR